MTAEISPKPNVEISINPKSDKINIEVDIKDFLEAPDNEWIALRANIRDHLIEKKIIEEVKKDNND